MLDEVTRINLWWHRPPNNPEWEVFFKYDGRNRKINLFAVDGAGAYAKAVRMTRQWDGYKPKA
jgi:hypothetical protein